MYSTYNTSYPPIFFPPLLKSYIITYFHSTIQYVENTNLSIQFSLAYYVYTLRVGWFGLLKKLIRGKIMSNSQNNEWSICLCFFALQVQFLTWATSSYLLQSKKYFFLSLIWLIIYMHSLQWYFYKAIIVFVKRGNECGGKRRLERHKIKKFG